MCSRKVLKYSLILFFFIVLLLSIWLLTTGIISNNIVSIKTGSVFLTISTMLLLYLIFCIPRYYINWNEHYINSYNL